MLRHALIFSVLIVSACASTGAPELNDNVFVGTYGATLPAASGGGERKVMVALEPGRFATVSSEFTGRPGLAPLKGTWDRVGQQVNVYLGGPRPERMVFELDNNRLVARQWDRTTWGEAGPGTLIRQ